MPTIANQREMRQVRRQLTRKLGELELEERRLAGPAVEASAPVQYGKRAGDHVAEAADRHARAQAGAELVKLGAEVRAALERLAKGSYGVCASCGESIPRARLEALPWATQCVACKARGVGPKP